MAAVSMHRSLACIVRHSYTQLHTATQLPSVFYLICLHSSFLSLAACTQSFGESSSEQRPAEGLSVM